MIGCLGLPFVPSMQLLIPFVTLVPPLHFPATRIRCSILHLSPLLVGFSSNVAHCVFDSLLTQGLAGIQPVDVPGIENVRNFQHYRSSFPKTCIRPLIGFEPCQSLNLSFDLTYTPSLQRITCPDFSLPNRRANRWT